MIIIIVVMKKNPSFLTRIIALKLCFHPSTSNKFRSNTRSATIKLIDNTKAVYPTADPKFNIVAIIGVPLFLEKNPKTATLKATLLTGVPLLDFHCVAGFIPWIVANTVLETLQKARQQYWW